MDVAAALASYRASHVRVRWEGRVDAFSLDGGGLADAFDRIGRGLLAEVLDAADADAVELSDGDLTVSAVRDGGRGRLLVRWGTTLVVDEELGADVGIADLEAALRRIDLPLVARRRGGAARWYRLPRAGSVAADAVALVPAVSPGSLGSAAFRAAHGVKWAYKAGAMAGGIASVELVLAMQKAGLLACFGAGGLDVDAVEAAVARIRAEASGDNWASNLLHNPNEPDVEERLVDVYLRHGVRRVTASAYLEPTAALVRYRLTGLHRAQDGQIVAPNQILAKVSRPEVAARFLNPPNPVVVRALVERGVVDADVARLAEHLPLAGDVTAEADSGGHTDHRPLVVLLPELLALRDRVQAERRYTEPPRIGAAGGLGTPAALHAAFAMGADYVVVGSANQASVEAGTHRKVKEMLAQAGPSDVASGPAPDHFEQGAAVQVLARGSMYAARAERLRDAYREYPSLDAIPSDVRTKLEKQLFKRPLDDVWADTRSYWERRDPTQVERALREPRHQLALTFRWYLGMTSRWARQGDPDRALDYQIWCGPAMGAFNDWARGGPLEPLDQRGVVAIATALMEGACVEARRAAARGW
jgi:trans-AT polyketide synthase/acyltransferase/oxidoreductase domain-containing protein